MSPRRTAPLAGLLTLALLAPLLPRPSQAAATGKVRRFALIVGNNRSLDARDPVLRYADDDAARLWELFRLVSDRTALLTVPDARTQKLHPQATDAAKAPTRRNLLAAFQAMNAEMQAAEKAGDRPIFYLFFSGHGGMGQGREAFLHLLDERLTRGDLYREVVGASAATFNHVIIDACHSYFMVTPRGDSRREAANAVPDLTGAVKRYLEAESLERHPNTGALVATSGTAETHEWGLFEGGVFSHQVRSGLAGAADVDGDGAVSYPEMRAFLAAANAKVPPGPARLATFARAPRQRLAEPLLDLRGESGLSKLSMAAGPGPGAAGRFYVEDSQGVRWIDLNKTEDSALTVVLGDRGHYWVRTAEWEAKVPVTPGTVVALASLHRTAPGAGGGEGSGRTARGATSDLFSETLFAVPFGPSFAAGFTAGPDPDIDVVATRERAARPPVSPWVVGTASAAVALGVGSAVAGAMAVSSRNDYLRRFDEEGVYDRQLADSAESRALASNVLMGLAFASAGAAAVLHWGYGDASLDDQNPGGASLSVAPLPLSGGGAGPGFGVGVRLVTH